MCQSMRFIEAISSAHARSANVLDAMLTISALPGAAWPDPPGTLRQNL